MITLLDCSRRKGRAGRSMAQALGTIGFGLFGLAYTRHLARESPLSAGGAQRWCHPSVPLDCTDVAMAILRAEWSGG